MHTSTTKDYIKTKIPNNLMTISNADSECTRCEQHLISNLETRIIQFTNRFKSAPQCWEHMAPGHTQPLKTLNQSRKSISDDQSIKI